MNTAEQNTLYTGPQNIRMAWTFGSAKMPVFCTVMGSDPLYTYDEPESHASPDSIESIMDELMLAMELDDALADLVGSQESPTQATERQELLAQFDRIERAGAHLETYTTESVDVAFGKFCDGVNNASKVSATTDIDSLLAASGTLNALHAHLTKRGVTVAASDAVNGAVYDRTARRVLYADHQSEAQLGISLTRALRQAYLHSVGALIDPLHFLPEDAVLINRIYAADEAVHLLHTAWDLNLAGKRAMWSHILGTTGYDLAIAFAREAVSDFRTLDNGSAAHAVIDAWFFSGRCRAFDQSLIRDLLARDTGMSFVADGQLKSLGRELLSRIGERARGGNYLVAHINTLLSDPLYTDVRDRSSANFMWFLRFERQFREHEEIAASKASAPKTASVLTFPKRANDGTKTAQAKATGTSATIVSMPKGI